ncbi:DinB family protein [Paenibacillus filicis]|uniref:DinB family protein n=1 Tax=Paenibacillus filicis TaxID=669464 RepID=A0ABU9DPT6_9BACL
MWLTRIAGEDASSLAIWPEPSLELCETLADIFIHVALHGMYHRGQINLLLRMEDKQPAWVDYILFTRET